MLRWGSREWWVKGLARLPVGNYILSSPPPVIKILIFELNNKLTGVLDTLNFFVTI